MEPIIIAGFGRSGTTWLSDIISKTLGGIILFEPDHPSVFPESEKFIYRSHLNAKEKDTLQKHIYGALDKKIKKNWLLRNHLPCGSDMSENFIHSIWEQSNILGFKAIRWNHNLVDLYQAISPKIVYITRHPLAVAASLIKRSKFFKELGWEKHWSLFKERNPIPTLDLSQYDQLDLCSKYTAMWTVSNCKALTDLDKLDRPYFQYEKIYSNPYSETRKIIDYLGFVNNNIHPSYLFYPSMSTLKTFHTFNENRKWSKKGAASVFWENTFSPEQAQALIKIVKSICSDSPKVYETFHNLGYLDT